MRKRTLITGTLALLLFIACQKGTTHTAPPPKQAATASSDSARAVLRGYMENVTGADGKIYAAKDNTGKTMDCLKIIAIHQGGILAYTTR